MPDPNLFKPFAIKEDAANSVLSKIWHYFTLGHFLPWFVLVIGLGATYAVWTEFTEIAKREHQVKFDLEVQDIISRIQQRMLVQKQVLFGAAGLLSALKSVKRDEFHTYVQTLHLEQQYPGIQGLGFSLLIPAREREKHIAAIRKEGYSEYTITPTGQREVYTSTVYIEPFDWRNRRTFGYDMYSDPTRRSAMEQARDTEEAAISGKVTLLQETKVSSQPGFLMYVPVYNNRQPHETLVERRTNIVGWVFSPFRIYDLMSGTLGKFDRNLDIHIFDGEKTAGESMLYTAHEGQQESNHVPQFTTSTPINFNGHKWLVYIQSESAFEVSGSWQTAFVIVQSGIGLSFLLALLTWQLVHGRTRTVTIAHQMAHELRENEDRLHASEERWKFALEGSDQGVWDWDIQSGKVIFSSHGRKILGFGEDKISSDLGEWGERIHPDDKPQVLADLQAYLTNTTPIYVTEHRAQCKDGTYKWIQDRGMVVSRDDQGKPLRMIGTHTDITAYKEADRRLQESEAQLRAILDNSPFMIWLKDKEGRYLAGNKAWLKTTGYQDLQQIQGKTDYEIWPAEIAENFRVDDTEVLASGTQKFVEERAMDGDREFWSETYKTPILGKDGNTLGTTGFARDITEKKAFEAVLRESQKRLQVLFENSPVGTMAVAPESARILQANHKCLEMFGYTLEEIQERTVTDITDPADVQLSIKTMQKIARGEMDTAQFEKRYVRKDGSVFWGDVAITALRGEDGKSYWNIAAITDITVRKNVEQKLRAASEYSRSLIEASADPLVTINQDGNLVDVNKATERITGLDRIRLLGTDFCDYFTDPDEAHKAYHTVLLNGYVADYPLAMRHLDGHSTYVLYNASLYRNDAGEVCGTFATARDISHQKMIEDALRENQQYLLLMLETSPIAVRISSIRDNYVLFANQSYVELINSTQEQVIGTTPITYYANQQDYQDVLEQLARGVTVNNKLVELHIPADIHHAEKETTWALSSYMCMDYQGEHAVLGWFYDVTELRKAKEMAEEMAKVKAEFIANMSHEIRTPMNAIIGLSHLALHRDITSDVRDYLKKIHNASSSLLGILNDILDLSKTEAGRMSIDHSSFDLDIVLTNVRNLFVARAEEKFLDFEIGVAADVPRSLIGDALRLQQILTNLLGNAFKFTERGAISLNIALSKREQSQATLFFSVCDSGIGISQDDIARLFQPFVQVDGSSTRRFGGTGLGLTISKNLLHLMGSDFQVFSTPGKGTTFSFELVLELSAQASQSHENITIAESLGADLSEIGETLSGIHVLLAEDHEINQQVIEEYLKLSGVSVALANNGREALDMLEKNQFDAVLMDVHMPEMNGIEATRKIRKQERFAQLPILAISAGVTEREHQECLACGMNDFITKPINPEQLIATLSHWVRRHASSHQNISANIQSNDPWSNIVAIPGFDPDKLRIIAKDDATRAIKLLLSFATDINNISAEMEAALARGNFAAAAEQAHYIKDAANNVGASSLYAVADSLEDEFRAGQSSPVTLTNFQQAFKQTVADIFPLSDSSKRTQL